MDLHRFRSGQVFTLGGALFDDDTALPLEEEDLADLLAAAKPDWSEIDPSIPGARFERGLDRDKIMQIVTPNGLNNGAVVFPLLNGTDIAKRSRDRWIINFCNLSETEASLVERPFGFVAKHVRPLREKKPALLARRATRFSEQVSPAPRRSSVSLCLSQTG